MKYTHDDVIDLAAAFVLGALTPEEDAAVREHIATCDIGHPEIDELGGVAQTLALAAEPVEPPASLKLRILERAAEMEQLPAEPSTSRPAGRPTADEAADQRRQAAAPIPFPTAAERAALVERRTSPPTWLVRIAAVVAIVALAGYNVLLQQQLNSAHDYDSAVAAVIQTANQQGSQSAILKPAAPNGPEGIAAVSANGQLTIAMRNLTPTTGSEVYEAWAIVGKNAPMPIGSFQVGTAGTGVISGVKAPTEAGVAFAFTREPGPGATAPTLPILSVGVASAPPSG
jgi:anti-sigma-K factor RskA